MDTLISLPPDEIHLWLAYYDEIIDEPLHAAYRRMLSDTESSQESRFHFPRDRRRYLVTRALVRSVLSRYAAVPPECWRFSNNEYGRPELTNGEATDLKLSFNVAHTHSVIVLGVTRGRALGVDVENIAAREVSLQIAEHFFAPEEVTALVAVPSDQQQYRFFEYWTFKESYIKARGMGLSLPLDKFSFHYPSADKVAIAIHPALADPPQRWQFWQLQPGAPYLVAVCAERVGARSPTVVVRRIIPLLGEQLLAARFLRQSIAPVDPSPR